MVVAADVVASRNTPHPDESDTATSDKVPTGLPVGNCLVERRLLVPVYEPLSIEKIGVYLRDGMGDFPRQWRYVLEFLEGFRHQTPAIQRQLIVTEPSAVDARWDAFLAGLAVFVAERQNLPVPAWADDPNRRLTTRWFLIEDSMPNRETQLLRDFAEATCPEPFRTRGVYLEPDDLHVAGRHTPRECDAHRRF